MSTTDELEKLAHLRDQGILTEDEFQLQKYRVLAESMPASASDPPPATVRDIVVTIQPDYWGGSVTKAETYARELVNLAQTRWDVDVLREGQRWLLRPHNEADTYAIEEFVSREPTRAISNVPDSEAPRRASTAPTKNGARTFSQWLDSLDKVKSFGVILHCPRCGSDQLREIRSAKGIVMAGVFAPKTRVECKMCGNRAYKSALRRSQ